MAKWFSLIAFIIAAAAAYLGFESQKLVETLQSKGVAVKSKLDSTVTELTKTKATLKETEDTLTKTKGDLEDTKAKLATAIEAETKAKADLTAAQGELTKAQGDLAGIQKAIEEAFPGEGLKAIDSIKTKITDLTNKNKELEATVATLTATGENLKVEVAALKSEKETLEVKAASDNKVITRYKDGIMEKGARGKVLAVNAGWGFCVTSLGDKKGGAANKILIVVRNGQAIGRVKITNVEATQSIADILPGTFARNTYVQPGDDVIYTGEDKVNVEEAAGAGAVGSPALPPR